VAVDHQDSLRRERARGVEHVGEQRPAGERMKHLGQLGAHALAKPCRENDDFERHFGLMESADSSTAGLQSL
jgi:hypothetical protein